MGDKVFGKNYAEYYELFNKGKDYSNEVKFLEKIFQKYGENIKNILDLGCGTGIHVKLLASKGYNITGLDLSKEMIDIAKSKNILNAEFIVGDMSNFNLNKKFDVVICMFAVMDYLTENKQIESFFKSVKNHLNSDGLLVLDVWNGLGVMNELPTSREKSSEIEGLKIVRRSFPDLDIENHINNVKFEVKVSKNNKLIDEYEENHKVRFFFPQELRKYLEDEEFEIVKICPSYELDKKISEKDWNMVLICKFKKL